MECASSSTLAFLYLPLAVGLKLALRTLAVLPCTRLCSALIGCDAFLGGNVVEVKHAKEGSLKANPGFEDRLLKPESNAFQTFGMLLRNSPIGAS